MTAGLRRCCSPSTGPIGSRFGSYSGSRNQNPRLTAYGAAYETKAAVWELWIKVHGQVINAVINAVIKATIETLPPLA